MATISPYPRVAVFRGLSLPPGVRAMLSRASATAVLVSAIVCTTVVVLAVLAAVVWLVGHGYGTEAVIGLVGSLVIPYVIAVFGRLVNAAIMSPPPAPAPENTDQPQL